MYIRGLAFVSRFRTSSFRTDVIGLSRKRGVVRHLFACGVVCCCCFSQQGASDEVSIDHTQGFDAPYCGAAAAADGFVWWDAGAAWSGQRTVAIGASAGAIGQFIFADSVRKFWGGP
jgi:hypothetical protein